MLAWGISASAFAWIYPEHRDIAVLAVQGLDAEHKAVFDRFWQEARAGDEQRSATLKGHTAAVQPSPPAGLSSRRREI